MSAQKPLFQPPPATGNLTARQSFALRYLERHRQDGVKADELGAALHARRGRHPEGERCRFCSNEGQDVLRALRRKGLARQRRGIGWVALSAPGPADDSCDPQSMEIPF